jgi:F-type H+-transporting ATPase subunit delta
MQGASREALAAGWDDVQQQLGDASADDARTLSSQLFGIVDLLDDQVSLRRPLSDPSFEPDRKSGLLEAVLGSHVSATTLEVASGLVRARWSRMRDLGDAVEQLAVLAELIAAEKDNEADAVEDQLFRFGRILEVQAGLRAAIADPGLPASNKAELLDALLQGKAANSTIRLLTQLAGHPRGRAPEAGVADYSQVASQRRKRLVALVRAATSLSDAEQDRLRTALIGVYGGDIHLEVEIDPSIVGGVVVRVGDDVIDGSVANRLADAKQKLA